MSHKLVWKPYNRRPGVWLRLDFQSANMWETEIGDELIRIATWCSDHKCGCRQAYDMWRFKNQAEVTMFLMRWS